MKFPQFEPNWILWVGFLVAPLACALNVALLEAFFSDSPVRTGEWLPIGVVMIFLTGPQGAVSYAIWKFWGEAKHRAARITSLICALLAPLFWWFCWHGLELKMQWKHQGAIPMFGALFLPVLWSFLFLLFALFARRRKT